MNFSDLGLSQKIINAITRAGFTTPTPIQSKAIPIILQGSDIIACAQTGTGKTASFLLPIIDHLLHTRRRFRLPRCLILEPTRELATQVQENFEKFTNAYDLKAATLVGGESMTRQEKLLGGGIDVLIATPGRLLDIIERNNLLVLNDVACIVIDEADRMLDMGFIPDVNKILAALPTKRQTVMLSATLSDDIRRLADQYTHFAKTIEIKGDEKAAKTIKQYVVKIPTIEKRQVLRHILRYFNPNEAQTAKRGIIFCNRKSDINILVKSLKRHGFNVDGLHGDMTQHERNRVLDEFRSAKIPLLVASDVAARGIDVSDLELVVNFNVPMQSEEYIHRIGRTGRAGQTGTAFTLYDTEIEKKYWQGIKKLVGEEIEEYKVELIDDKPINDRRNQSTTELIDDKPSIKPGNRPAFKKENRSDSIIGFGNEVPAFFLIKL
jgi:superfamily II DNA/RNA helicase